MMILFGHLITDLQISPIKYIEHNYLFVSVWFLLDNKQMNGCIPKVKSIEIGDTNEISMLNDSNSSTW